MQGQQPIFSMKEFLMQAVKLFSLVTFAGLVLSACSSTPVVETNKTTAAAEPTKDTRSVGTVNAVTDPLNDPKGALAQRSVYFDYDSYSLKSEAKPVTETHAKYLAANKGRKIAVQGNTDERGGTEYNLALGQKRAEAVRKSLSLMGVPESQMEAVSFGKEKPKAKGADEASWAENRRADIVYQ
jgi:peptidoglycan-associated lipoprotein